MTDRDLEGYSSLYDLVLHFHKVEGLERQLKIRVVKIEVTEAKIS